MSNAHGIGPSGLLGLPVPEQEQDPETPRIDSKSARFQSMPRGSKESVNTESLRPNLRSECSSDDAPLLTPRTRAVSVRWDIGDDGSDSDEASVREARLSAFSMHLAKYVPLPVPLRGCAEGPPIRGLRMGSKYPHLVPVWCSATQWPLPVSLSEPVRFQSNTLPPQHYNVKLAIRRHDLSYTYVLSTKLGVGASAEVWAAEHRLTEEVAAIKVFLSTGSDAIHAAATEFVCAMRSSSPHALEYRTLAFIDGKPALVMEMAEVALDDWIQVHLLHQSVKRLKLCEWHISLSMLHRHSKGFASGHLSLDVLQEKADNKPLRFILAMATVSSCTEQPSVCTIVHTA